MEKGETICRLCLKDSNNNFTVLDANATEFVDFLLKSNLSVNIGALICAECTRSIKDCSNFKSKCLDVENVILQRTNHMLDENDILDHDVCSLCMRSLKMYSIISSDDTAGDAMLEKIMLEKCLPELDTRITEKPIICSPCRESLQHYFGFITNCLNVEEKIKKYCAAAGIDCTGLIKLKDVIEFTIEPESIKVDRIKVEDNFYGDEHVDEKSFSEEPRCASENVQEVTLKEEDTFLEEIDCKIELKSENPREVDEQQFENVYDQEHLNSFEVDIDSSQPVVTTRVNGLTPNLEEDHSSKPSKRALTKKDLAIYKCNSCSHETKYRAVLYRHLLKHRNPSEVTMYKCDSCLYQTIYKCNFTRHFLKHKNSSEVTMYKCDSCPYETKYNSCFHRHLLRHRKQKCLKSNLQGDLSSKSPSQTILVNEKVTTTIMYKCEYCSYQSKFKRALDRHLLTHKDPSEVTLYKCVSCPYRTKYKETLGRHMLIHKDPSEVKMYRCDSCSYQTKQKFYLVEHVLRHRCPSDITIYKCDSCSYQTKFKSNLKKHVLKHGDPSRVPIYKCDSCSYRSKFKYALTYHLLKHKDPSEVLTYKCDYCSYQATTKYALKEHLLKHKDPSEVEMYKCNCCSFQTKYKSCYNRHLQKKPECLKSNLQSDLSLKPTHQMTNKKATTPIRYPCEFCKYQAKKKDHLKNHCLVRHKDPSEVEVYKCNFCSYQAILKGYLKRHLLKHHSEVKL